MPEVAQSLASVKKWIREGQVDLDGQLAHLIQHAGLKDLRKDAIQPIQCPSSGTRWRRRRISWPNRERDLPPLGQLARRRRRGFDDQSVRVVMAV